MECENLFFGLVYFNPFFLRRARIEVELLAGGSQLESESIFRLLESLKIGHIIAWRLMKGKVNPPEVLSVKDRIDVEGPDWMRVFHKRLRAAAESFNGRAKNRLALQRLTWQVLENVGIHVGLVLTVAEHAFHSRNLFLLM